MTLAFAVLVALAAQAQQPNFDNVQMDVQHVQGNVYMISGAGFNSAVQVGKDGVLVVDTMPAPLAPKLLAEIRKLSSGPILWLINTHSHADHVGGNLVISKAAVPVVDPFPSLNLTAADAGVTGVGVRGAPGLQPLKIVAHENVLNRLTEKAPGQTSLPEAALPRDEYSTRYKDLHTNGEAIILYHEPNAHTDGDSGVLFRGSDVVVTGDIFTPGGYPFIDVDHGGSIQGQIDALNHILELTIPVKTQEGGTAVIPGHGRLSDEADVVEYRDMVVIVRDRIQDLIKKGRTLEQIRASRPTLDYDVEYVTPNSFVTADAFVESVYRSLTKK